MSLTIDSHEARHTPGSVETVGPSRNAESPSPTTARALPAPTSVPEARAFFFVRAPGQHTETHEMSYRPLPAASAVQNANRKQILQWHADAIREAQMLNATIADERRAFKPEEKTRINALLTHLDDVRTAKQRSDIERELELSGQAVPDPEHEAHRAAMAAAGLHVVGNSYTPRENARGDRLTFEALHGRRAASTDGWQDPAEIFRTIASGMNDHRLRAAGQGGNNDTIGGYALPTSTEIQIFNGLVGPSIFMPRANVQPMTTRQQDVATFDRSNDGTNGTMFGLGFEFIPEGGSGASVQTTTLRMISMNAHTGAILFDASNELLQDAAGFESGLLRVVQLAAAYGIDRYCLNGTGAGQPLGVRNLPSLITVSKETGQAADSIVYENLTKMFSRLPASSVTNSVWLASQSCIPELSTLSVPVGTAGSHIPVMTSRDGSFEILTRPMIFSALLRPVGDLGDIMLVDLSQYTVGMRAGMAVDRSQHVGFAKNRTTFRLLLRFDGGSGWDQAFQPEHSQPTQSPFIQLQAR
jgi:HK97 family phage major capsid protein